MWHFDDAFPLQGIAIVLTSITAIITKTIFNNLNNTIMDNNVKLQNDEVVNNFQVETRTCKCCGITKPINEFRKYKENVYSQTCLKCIGKKVHNARENSKLQKLITNDELSKFTPRELINELKNRGYKGKLYYTNEIVL